MVSLWPNHHLQRIWHAAPSLIAANGTKIGSYGTTPRQINFNDYCFDFMFIVADVPHPILGLDFLSHFKIVVDCPNRALILNSGSTIPFIFTDSRIHGINLIQDHFSAILSDFPEVFDTNLATRTTAHGVECFVPTTGPPIKTLPRRLTPEKLSEAKQHFDIMCAAGICRRSSSAWSSGLHLVCKIDGTLRPCGNYRRLNAITMRDNYPLPHIHDCLSGLNSCTIFSKIDLVKSYHQIPVASDDIPKTAISTPFGLFEFLSVPFGLQNAAQSFQRLMDVATSHLPGVRVYLDDVLVASKDSTEHEFHLRSLFRALSQYGLVVNRAKCVFGRPELEFLGHVINARGIRPTSDQINAILQYQQPTTIKSLQRFLGLINFYRRFIPKLASIVRPLTDALTGHPKHLDWTTEMTNAFYTAKTALASSTQLVHHIPGADLELSTDASCRAIAGVLNQTHNGTKSPLAFFSRRTSGAESRYSAFDLELLAIYHSILHFRHLLEGRKFSILTDQKLLTRSMLKTQDPVSNRQRQQLAFISEFCTELSHVHSVDNTVADSLSRQYDDDIGNPFTVSTITHRLLDFDAHELATAQQTEENDWSKSSLLVKSSPYPPSNVAILCDISSTPRIIIPPSWRRRIFDQIHGMSHPSGRTTRRLVASSYVWPGMNHDIKKWTRGCHPCQVSKIARHTRSPLSCFPVPRHRFLHIHVDLIGPLPLVDGFRYALTMVDRTTSWSEVAPIRDLKADTTTHAFNSTWIARFGVPETVTADRGSQFTSDVWQQALTKLGIKPAYTTAYHPQSNGMVERFHRSLKNSLRCLATTHNWIEALPWVLLGLRTAPRDDIANSPAKILYGLPLRIPGICFPDHQTASALQQLETARTNVKNFTPVVLDHTKFKFKQYIPSDLRTAQNVFLHVDTINKGPLGPRYTGPFQVLHRDLNKGTFIIQTKRGPSTVSINRLKTANVP